jgi:hypothetical protein
MKVPHLTQVSFFTDGLYYSKKPSYAIGVSPVSPASPSSLDMSAAVNPYTLAVKLQKVLHANQKDKLSKDPFVRARLETQTGHSNDFLELRNTIREQQSKYPKKPSLPPRYQGSIPSDGPMQYPAWKKTQRSSNHPNHQWLSRHNTNFAPPPTRTGQPYFPYPYTFFDAPKPAKDTHASFTSRGSAQNTVSTDSAKRERTRKTTRSYARAQEQTKNV